jgi:HSP20 family protein
MTQRRSKDRLTSEMEELVADLWHHRLAPQRTGFRPRVDVYRTAEPPTLHVVVELPGVDPEQVDVAVNEGVLLVTGRRQRPHDCGRKYEHIEIDYGSFERRIVLGDGFEAEAAQATYEQGLLTIALPLRQRKPGPVRVPVRGEESA